MIASIFLSVVFSASGARIEARHPSMEACVAHVMASWGVTARSSGWCDEKVGDLAVCSTAIMGAPFWGKSQIVRSWCLDGDKIARIRRISS